MASAQTGLRSDDEDAGASCSPRHDSHGRSKAQRAADFNDLAGATGTGADHYEPIGGESKNHSDALLKEAQLANKAAPPSKFQKIQGAILPIVVLVIIISLVVMLFIINSTPSHHATGSLLSPVDYLCHDQCRLVLAETIPANLSLGNSSAMAQSTASTYGSWIGLLAAATSSIDLFTYSLSLRPLSNGSLTTGRDVYGALVAAGRRSVAVRVIVNDDPGMATDVEALRGAASAAVKRVNFTSLFGGVLDATFIVVDSKSFYLGSADMDQKSLSEVKELGVTVSDCGCLAAELSNVFEGYWRLEGTNTSALWPASLDARYNATQPLNVTFAVEGASERSSVASYFTSSPHVSYSAPARSPDAEVIVSAIARASRTVDIAVGKYSPVADDNTFWPAIDNSIRAAVLRIMPVTTRLLVSFPAPGSSDGALLLQRLRFLVSLADFSSRIQVKLFVVPRNITLASTATEVINNNNYLVTDNLAYVGTSDWTAASFLSSVRFGLVANETTSSGSSSVGSLRAKLQQVFDRDWSSRYALDLSGAAVDTVLGGRKLP